MKKSMSAYHATEVYPWQRPMKTSMNKYLSACISTFLEQKNENECPDAYTMPLWCNISQMLWMFGHTRFPKKKKQENIGKRIFDKYSYESGYSFETGYFPGHLGAKLGPTKYQKHAVADITRIRMCWVKM